MPERDDLRDVWSPRRPSRRAQILDRLQVTGAVIIVLGLVIAAAIALL